MSKFKKLHEALEQDGWSITKADPPSEGWWAFEIWILQSKWRPVGKLVYLTLKIHPMNATKRPPSESDVWDIGLTHEFPLSEPDNGIIYEKQSQKGLLKKWPDLFKEAITRASNMRGD